MVSIIIPVYNVEKYIERMLATIVKQTYKSLEIILVDDGSTDSCGKICDEWAKKDNRIVVIHKKNGGLSSARNVGINIARGEYLFFCDSDDYISKNCVEYLYNTICNNQADIVVGNYIETSLDNQGFNIYKVDEHVLSGKQAIKEIYGKNNVQMVTAWGKIYKASLFDNIRYPVGLLHEDEGTTYKLYYKCKKVIVSNKPIYAYFINNNSITKKTNKQNYIDLCNVLKEQAIFFEKHNEIEFLDYTCVRYCIQMAAHYLPLNYYGNNVELKRVAKKYYSKISNKTTLDRKLLLKAWICINFTWFASKMMSI